MAPNDPNVPTIQQDIDTASQSPVPAPAAQPFNGMANTLGVAPPVAPNLNRPADDNSKQNQASFDNVQMHGQPNAPGSPGAQLADYQTKFKQNFSSPSSVLLASTPGGVMKALMAAGIEAMGEKAPEESTAGKAQRAFRSFLAPLAGNSGGLGGAGNAAAGALKIQNADRDEQLKNFNEQHKQKMADIKDNLQLAQDNARMIHSQYLQHMTELKDTIESGTKAFNTIKNSPGGHVDTIGEGLDTAEINRRIQEHTDEVKKAQAEGRQPDPNVGIDPATMTAYPTDQKDSGRKYENGEAVMDPTYSVIRAPKTVQITDKNEAKELMPEAQGLDNVDKDHPLTVPFSLYNSRWQARDTQRAAQMATQAATDTFAAATDAHNAKVEAKQFAGDSFWTQDLATANKRHPGDPLLGYVDAFQMATSEATTMKGPDGKPKYPNIANDIISTLPGADQKEKAAYFDKMLAQVDKQNAAKELDRQKAQEKAEQSLKNSDNPDDIAKLGESLATGLSVPSTFSPRDKNYKQVLIAADNYSMAHYGVHFDFEKSKRDYDFADKPATQNTLKYLNSLTGNDNKSGNLQILVNQSSGINRTEFPPLNDVAAWARLKFGDPAMAEYLTTVTEVSDQIAKILQGGNGGASTDAKLKQAQELFNKGFTKDQILSVANDMRDLLANRKSELVGDNFYLQKQYGANVPTHPTLNNPNNQNQPSQTDSNLAKVPSGSKLVRDPKTRNPIGYVHDGTYVSF